ncbi:hypothetical protein CFN78_18305 [Amycolatopsis antarctica]|uniref:BFN domain-containing protein n=1 Tax=Amycolatopsis antarctica TaxID=1854586 RepID=A0A263D030_9PSEU|nr:hypothetical protein CFN78_18305 [Amycolatopsis antarctica]
MDAVVRMEFTAVVLIPDEPAPVMLLRETEGLRRWLPIVIGEAEADELIAAHKGVDRPRPGTIELIAAVLEACDHRIERVEVPELRDGIFIAELVLTNDVRVSARPSDAVALGVRAGVTTEVGESVLAVASVDIALGDDLEDSGAETDDHEREIAEFRTLLELADPDDFVADPGEDPDEGPADDSGDDRA